MISIEMAIAIAIVAAGVGVGLDRLIIALVLDKVPDSFCVYCEWKNRKRHGE